MFYHLFILLRWRKNRVSECIEAVPKTLLQWIASFMKHANDASCGKCTGVVGWENVIVGVKCYCLPFHWDQSCPQAFQMFDKLSSLVWWFIFSFVGFIRFGMWQWVMNIRLEDSSWQVNIGQRMVNLMEFLFLGFKLWRDSVKHDKNEKDCHSHLYCIRISYDFWDFLWILCT